MKRIIWMAAVVVFSAMGTIQAAGPGGGGGGGGAALTPQEEEGLIFMREEEKLARDVYTVFDGLYDLPIFSHIAASEQRHMDAVLTLLVRYNVDDPAAGNDPGVFSDASLQALYDELVAQGGTSLESALSVGVIIEETDIADLEERLLDVVHNDIERVYENLLRGSTNHLAAFESVLGIPNSDRPAARAGAGRHRCRGHHGQACRGFGAGVDGGLPRSCCLFDRSLIDAVRVEGVIAVIDADAEQLVVGDTTVAVTSDTVIKMRGRIISFDDLAIGQTVAACGVLNDGILEALRVTVRFGGQ